MSKPVLPTKSEEDHYSYGQLIKHSDEVSSSEDKPTDDLVENKVRLFVPLSPNARKFRCLIGSVIALEGLIGAGKSTSGKSLANYLNDNGIKAKYFPEYYNAELLSQYISDMKKYAYPFQVIMVQERKRIGHSAAKFAKEGGVAIVDRSLAGDYTFASMQKEEGNIDNDEWSVYESLLVKEPVEEPALILFLECKPKTAFERMKKRSHKEEVDGYELSYFENLDKAYKKCFQEIEHPVLYISWNTDRRVTTDEHGSEQLIDEDCEFLLTNIRDTIFDI